MTVYVNDTATEIFSGATAQEAASRYAAVRHLLFNGNELYDTWGNVIAPDSPMSEGRRIYTNQPYRIPDCQTT